MYRLINAYMSVCVYIFLCDFASTEAKCGKIDSQIGKRQKGHSRAKYERLNLQENVYVYVCIPFKNKKIPKKIFVDI